jgi:phosphate transport system permease protein
MTTTSAPTPALRGQRRSGVLAERAFRVAAAAAAAASLAVLTLMLVRLGQISAPAWLQGGDELLAGSRWAPGRGSFGVLPFLYGTLVTSAIAISLAVPVAVGTALFLSEAASEPVRRLVVPLVDLLAAVPSVVYGLWGILVLVPALRPLERWLADSLGGAIALFQGPVPGVGYLTAGVVLAVMILPIISAVSREVFLAVPREQREAALALGATRWETIRLAVLPASRAGVLGAAVLGLGRALGETIAVAMVIGNAPRISASVLAPGSTMASLIANEFSEATRPLHLEALVAVGLLLFVVALAVNVLARLLTRRVIRR